MLLQLYWLQCPWLMNWEWYICSENRPPNTAFDWRDWRQFGKICQDSWLPNGQWNLAPYENTAGEVIITSLYPLSSPMEVNTIFRRSYISVKQSLSKANGCSTGQETPIMEPHGPLLCLQESIIGPYPQLVLSSWHLHTLFNQYLFEYYLLI